MTFTEKLIRLRKREGLSQEELAQYLDVSRQAISRWEQGTAMPDAGNLLKLRRRFSVSVDWLIDDAYDWGNMNGPETQTAPEPVLPQTHEQWRILPWAVPLSVSGLGLVALGIFASLHPGHYETAVAAPFGIGAYRNVVYTGLFGSLKCYRLEWLFWLCAVMAVGSLAAGLWQKHLRLKAERRKREQDQSEG